MNSYTSRRDVVDREGKDHLKEIEIGFGSTGEKTQIEYFNQITEVDNNHKEVEVFISSLSLP
jgi:hypothetical protein